MAADRRESTRKRQ